MIGLQDHHVFKQERQHEPRLH